MIAGTGNPMVLLALVWPLALAVLAALPPVRRHAIRLLPLAPLPALWLGLTGAEDGALLPDFLLGVTLAAVPAAVPLFVMTAALWFAAALYSQAYMADTRKPAVFSAFWCLTLAGNLGVFLAADVVTFYVAFATVSLAGYVLIVHDATREALRAGRVYIVMVVLGEVCLLAAFVIGIAAADSTTIADVRAALSASPLGGLAAVLLVAGFGIKAGLMPLHVWLPLAHPAAPTPASAVLSGAIVKAGIIGLILFLPSGVGSYDWFVALGFAGAFAGAILGLAQTNTKAILAYSTISQMSLVCALIGTTVAPDAGFEKIAYYALHHGLAKGALFLSVGLVAACAGGWRWAMLAATGLVALSVAGAPLTGGNLAKLAAKSPLEGEVELALTLTAITTTLVLAWFVIRLAQAEPGKGHPPALLAVPTLALGCAALGVPWLLGPQWSGLEPGYALKMTSLWTSGWPVAAGLVAVAVLVWGRDRLSPAAAAVGRATQGLHVRLDATFRALHRAMSVAPDRKRPTRALAALDSAGALAEAFECRLRRGRHASLLMVIVCGLIAFSGLLWR